MATLNGRLEHLERELVTIVPGPGSPARRPLSGPVPSDQELQAAEARVVARVYRDIADQEGRGRAEWVIEQLGRELLEPGLAVARSTADDQVLARRYQAQGGNGWRQLEERKARVYADREARFNEIACTIASSLAPEFLDQVAADVERGAAVTPITRHLLAIARQALLTEAREVSPGVGYHGPLCIPEAVCKVLLACPDAAGDLWRDCGDCGLAIPSIPADAPVQGVLRVAAFDHCPLCGSRDIGPHAFWIAHGAVNA